VSDGRSGLRNLRNGLIRIQICFTEKLVAKMLIGCDWGDATQFVVFQKHSYFVNSWQGLVGETRVFQVGTPRRGTPPANRSGPIIRSRLFPLGTQPNSQYRTVTLCVLSHSLKLKQLASSSSCSLTNVLLLSAGLSSHNHV
jgi:hypothetical protein